MWSRRVCVTWLVVLLGVGAAGVWSTNIASSEGGAETFAFQAEVSRLMDIIINSLYQNKDIFLRELISNASDALDKLRFLALTNEVLKDTGNPLDIRVEVNKESKILKITDKGIGMTREDMISNLGTVARSGTSKFLEAMSSGKDAVGLIGQFGVGFYSAFLVADIVKVTSKHANDSQYVWESDAKSDFKVYKDPQGDSLGIHGTSISLYIKDGAEEYLEQDNLEAILKRYSEFIEFPIFLHKVKTVTEEVEEEPEESEATEDVKDGEESEGSTENEEVTAEEVDETPKTKKVERQVEEWAQVNEHKPIWTRSKSDITEEEYGKFFKALVKDEKAEALSHTHFKAEGGLDFSALLYLPSEAPSDLYDKYYSRENEIKLYIRHVLVQSDIEDMLPRYLNFIQGVVESNDLPISVSRETIQKNKNMKVIGKKLAKSALKMIQDIANEDSVDEEDHLDAEESEGEEPSETKYEKFWKQYGRSIRLGVLEDKKNKVKLMKLLRFNSVQSPKKLISLEQYVDNMPENQQYIYYITGVSQEHVQNSPLLEQLKKRNFDVLFFVDNVDAYMIPSMESFDDKKLMSVTKEGLKFGEEDDEEADKELANEFEKMTTWFAELLGKDRIVKCVVSKRIASSPATLVAPMWAWDANMIRVMQSQTFSDFEQQKFMTGNRVLEINPYHPIIKEMKRRIEEDENMEELEDLATFVYDAALLGSGHEHKTADDVSNFVERINTFVAKSLDVENQPIEEPKPKSKTEPVEGEEPMSESNDEDKDEL